MGKIGIIKSFTAGYYCRISRKNESDAYTNIMSQSRLFIHPCSSIILNQPTWILFGRTSISSKEYMLEVLVTKPSWAIEMVPRFFQDSNNYKMTRHMRFDRLDPLYV